MHSVGGQNYRCSRQQQIKIQAWIYKIFTLGWVLVLLVKQTGNFQVRTCYASRMNWTSSNWYVRCLWWREPCKVSILTILFRVGFLVLFSPLFYANVPPLVTWLIIKEERLFWGCTAFRQCTSRVMVKWECLKCVSTLSLKFSLESRTDSGLCHESFCLSNVSQFHDYVVSWVL